MKKPTYSLSVAGALLLSLLLSLAFTGCGGPSGVRVTQGDTTIGSAPTGTVYRTDATTIVHVNSNERVVTMSNAGDFSENVFLETRDREGLKTALLKTRESRNGGLRLADILEGMPRINDRATRVSATESERLSKIYREPTEE